MSSLANKPWQIMAILLVIVASLGGCGHEQVRRLPSDDRVASQSIPRQESVRRSVGELAAEVALRQVGVPYVYGGSTEQGFDCSGLIQFAYANVGKRIPRTTSQQWRYLTPISDRQMQVGDLLFFRIEGKVSHVGLYIGDRRFVHAPSTGRQVSVQALDSDFYRRAFVRAARP